MSLEFRGKVQIRDTLLGEVSIEMDLKLDRMKLPREDREDISGLSSVAF